MIKAKIKEIQLYSNTKYDVYEYAIIYLFDIYSTKVFQHDYYYFIAYIY